MRKEKNMHSKENAKESLTYAAAGVDIDAGNKAVELMKDSVKATYRPEVLGDLGGFGGLFSLMFRKESRSRQRYGRSRYETAPGYYDG